MIRNRYKALTLMIIAAWIISVGLFLIARRDLRDIYENISSIKLFSSDSESTSEESSLSAILRELMDNGNVQIEDIENENGESFIYIKYYGDSGGLYNVLDELRIKNKSIEVEKIIYENNEVDLKIICK